MKKFNITSEKLMVIAFSTIQTLCIFIAAAFALQRNSTYYDAIGAIGYLCIAAFFEWMKHKLLQYKREEEYEKKNK